MQDAGGGAGDGLALDLVEEERIPCDRCGRITRKVHGDVYAVWTEDGTQRSEYMALYMASWIDGAPYDPDHPARFHFTFGPWGEGTGPGDRMNARLLALWNEDGPFVQVVDAPETDLVGRGLRREEVIGSEFAQGLFAIYDAIWLQDPRVAVLHDGPG